MTGILNALLGNTSNPFAGAALSLAFDQTTTLDSRITFTRATSGTFFNSSGVLSTASSGAARFDHRLEGGVWVNKGLLIEEQRTNVCLRSEEFGTAPWAAAAVTLTNNNITAPDGTTTAERILETTTNTSHNVQQAFTLDMTSTNYAFSVFVKGGLGRTRGRLQIANNTFAGGVNANFNLSTESVSAVQFGTGVQTGATIQNVGNDWYRISIAGRTGQTGTHIAVIYILNDSGQDSYAGDTSKGLYLWGAQLEAGAFPTSYIKTTSASVTRNADVASMTSTNFSSWYNATEGTMFTQSTIYRNLPASTFPRIIQISNGTAAERIIMSYASDIPGLRNIVTDNSSNVVSNDFNVGQSNGINRKFATTYKVNDFAGSVDGGSVVTDTSGTLPTVSQINFGADENPANFLNGHIAKFYYWNTRKPDSFLQSITG
jgi:predicted DNA-binding transcriptional regulator AlpA